MALYSPEYGCKFELIGPDGTRATFNDLSDPDDVGVLTNISGLDSAEVRYSGEDMVEFDGAVQGPNWFGSRPVVLEGLVYGHATKEERAAKLDRLTRASMAMRSDATLRWTPSGGVPIELKLRRQQPLRIEGGWNKTFIAGMVAADPRIVSQALETAGGDLDGAGETQLYAPNEGNADAWPIFALSGPVDQPVINVGESGRIALNTNVLASQVVLIDSLKRTVHLASRALPVRTNLFPYPSFEVGTDHGFTSLNDAALSLVSPGAGPLIFGSQKLRITPNSAYADFTTGVARANVAPGIEAGDVVTVSFSFVSTSADSISRPMVVLSYRDSDGDGIAARTTVAAPYGGAAVAAPVRYVATGDPAAPAGTVSVDLEIHFIPPHGGGAYEIDGIVIENAAEPTDGTFFDGANPPDGYSAAWGGTPGASTSTATNLSPGSWNEAVPLVPLFSAVDFPQTIWTGLRPGLSEITTTADSADVGSQLGVRWRATWL